MEALSAWLQQIIVLLVIIGLVELMLPHGSLRRYSDVVLGFLVLGVILNPLVGFVGMDMMPAIAGQVPNELRQAPVPDRASLPETSTAATVIFVERVEREVVRLVMTVPGITGAAAAIHLTEGVATNQVSRIGSLDLWLWVRREAGESPNGGEPIDPSRPVPGSPGDRARAARTAKPPAAVGIRAVRPVTVTVVGSQVRSGRGSGSLAGEPHSAAGPDSPDLFDGGPVEESSEMWAHGAPEDLRGPVLELLARHFSLPEEQVRLYWRPARSDEEVIR
ncbi:MAG: stage III sporulation protein AF [Thermaerobacterales bacterium]